jgi:hypothetical protein
MGHADLAGDLRRDNTLLEQIRGSETSMTRLISLSVSSSW